MIDEGRLYRALGERLRKLREGGAGGNKLTQAEVAAKVGLERTSITNMEKGNQKVPLHVLYRICETFGVTVDRLLPPLAEVRPAATGELQEVEFSGHRYELPPVAASVLTKIVSEESTT